MAEETFGQQLMQVKSTIATYRVMFEKIEKVVESAHLAESAIASLTAEVASLTRARTGAAARLAELQAETERYGKEREGFMARQERKINEQIGALNQRLSDVRNEVDRAEANSKQALENLAHKHKDLTEQYDGEIARLTNIKAKLQAEIDALGARLKKVLG